MVRFDPLPAPRRTPVMRFTKMHGIGNDYVYVDCFHEKTPDDPATLAKWISNRHFGVGGDGLILICPSQVADARMRMFNADGSESEMCGNGIRCVAKYVHDHGIANREQLKIETGAGVLDLNLEIASGKVARVRVDMGEPILEAGKIPVDVGGSPEERVIDVPLEPHIALRDFAADKWSLDPRMTCVSMGNPHVILFCTPSKSLADQSPNQQVTALAHLLGRAIETDKIFPRRINVHFVSVASPTEVSMATWERGSGITLACGTGASAVCVAGFLTKRTERKILAHLPGGDLELEWGLDNHVYMTGAATEVFSGDWP
jgi:diaminopimelate epimerase